jgi:hypothetical protein
MPNIIRIIILILSIILTIGLFIYHMASFYQYMKRGKYRYESTDNEAYMVVKEGFYINNCPANGTTYSYGEVDWLIIRSKGHFLFLFCFWGALVLAFIISIFGSILEYVCKEDINCCKKFFRVLRSIFYKSSISIPVMVLFAFDYTKPCLELRQTTFMLFSNAFTYITVAIQFPVLIIVFIDVIYELCTWTPNATYILVRGTIKNQPICQKILRVVLYSVLFIIIISGILLSFVIYLELLILTDITHLLLVTVNILLSIIDICAT